MKPRKCEWCGKEFVDISNPKRRFCSKSCARKSDAYYRKKYAFDSKPLEVIVEEAAAAGMSYGEYTSKMTSDLLKERKK